MKQFPGPPLPAGYEAGGPAARTSHANSRKHTWGGEGAGGWGAHAHLFKPADDSAPRDGVDRVAVGAQPLHLCQRLVRLPVARHGHDVQRAVRGRHVLVVRRPRKHALRATPQRQRSAQPRPNPKSLRVQSRATFAPPRALASAARACDWLANHALSSISQPHPPPRLP